MDRPAEPIFEAEDLRLRWELTAAGGLVERVRDGLFALSAGRRRAYVHAAPGEFMGQAVEWGCGPTDRGAVVDAVCYRGPRRAFDFREPAGLALACGLELVDIEAEPSAAAIAIERCDERTHRATWQPAADTRLTVEAEHDPKGSVVW